MQIFMEEERKIFLFGIYFGSNITILLHPLHLVRGLIIKLTHLQCESLLFQSLHLSFVICLSSVCLSHIISWKLSEMGMKFHHPYRKSGSGSKNMTLDFAPEVAKYPKTPK